LYREPEGATLLAESFGVASAYPDAAADTGILLHQQLYTYLEQGLLRPSLHRAAPESWCEAVYAPQLREYLTVYEKQWEDVVDACQEGWGEAIF
jgi:hypothetical protein